ncbi:MAG TPA: hypothetical protein VLC09_07830 [Polyangiaceae bacterium]|nr:hypothetical protein [Polyangiaceae bacterium]
MPGDRQFGRTVIGLPSLDQARAASLGPVPSAAPPAEASHAPSVHAAPPADPATASAAPTARAEFRATRQGIGPDFENRSAEPAAASAVAQPHDTANATADADARSPSLQRTLLGVATPGITPTGAFAATPQPAQPAQSAQSAQSAQPAGAPAASPAATPSTTPGSANPSRHSPFPPATPSGSSAGDLRIPAAPRLPSQPARKSKPFPWRLLLAGMAGAAALGGSLALLTKRVPRVAVTAFEVSETGTDRLVLRCDGCAQGQWLSLGEGSATTSGALAPTASRQKWTGQPLRLEPQRRLLVGNNSLTLQVLDANGETAHETQLVVPIAFRIETSLEGKQADPPSARLIVRAPPNSHVRIAGRDVPLVGDAATLPIELTDARGETGRVQPLSLDWPIEVTTGSSRKNSSARVQAAITPLELLTPARGHVLQAGPLAVSGRTLPGTRVRLGSSEVVADAKGEFQLTLPAPQPGSLHLLAASGELVARVVDVSIGGPPTATATQPFPAAGSLQLDQNVVLTGTVVESRVAGERTTVLLEAEGTCAAPPCLARVFFGQNRQLRPGQRVVASGQPLLAEPPTLRAYRLD